jgi:hypothetical protein
MRLRTPLLLLAVCVACSLHAESAAERAAKAGELVTLKNHRVLRLFGDNMKERGFAHGYLLADQMLESIDGALNSLPSFSGEKFEHKLIPWAKEKFVYDADAKAEFEGIWEGLVARVGEAGLQSPTLKRKLTFDDLIGINAVPDYFGPGCSGFTVWGKLAGGHVLHGRNLDFPVGGKAIANQVLFVMEALPKRGELPARLGWVGVGWPGLTGAYSAMNTGGFVACIHDAYNSKDGGAVTGYVPRGMLLRRIVEAVDPLAEEPVQAAVKLINAKPVCGGNIFHLSWPSEAAAKHKGTPAAVLEFDSHCAEGPDAVGVRRQDADGFLVVTNHFCARCKAQECGRFNRITEGLTAFLKEAKELGLAGARKVLIGGEQEAAVNTHTIVFQPDERALSVALTRGNLMSTRVAGTNYTFKELFERGSK